MEEWVAVVVESIRVSLATQHRVVILKERHGERHLPIWIGPYEADCIAMHLQGVAVARPLPYDLFLALAAAAGAAIVGVRITALEGDVFSAAVAARVGDRTVALDARPSDAVAVALRAEAPLSVAPAVLDRAGVVFGEGGEPPAPADQ